ncbi:MAG: SpoIID/LytB domain-containing protein [Patescibacteria group bacterium]|jgi:hypothetical protein
MIQKNRATFRTAHFTVTLTAIILSLIFFGGSANAATLSAARMIASKTPSALQPLKPYTYNIGFKNTSSTAWSSSGSNRVTVKTTQNVRVEHWFASRSWINKLTVATMTPSTVKPGQIAYFNLPLETPQKTGNYDNLFALFSGNTKISGSDFTLSLAVGNTALAASNTASGAKANTPPLQQNSTSTPRTAAASSVLSLNTNKYTTGMPLVRSAQSLSLKAGETSTFTIGIKNTGDRNWRNAPPSLAALVFDSSSVPDATFKDVTWISDMTVMQQATPLVNSGELSFFTFTLKAPTTGGQFNPEFYLTLNNDTLINGTRFRIPITVSAPAPIIQPTLTSTNPTGPVGSVVCIAADASSDFQFPGDPNATGFCQPKHEQPMLRVGIDKLDGQLGVTANLPYIITDNTGKEYAKIAAGVTSFLSYNIADGTYTAVSPGPVIQSTLPLQIKTEVDPSIVTLTTFSNPVSYHPGWNDNSYRGLIEIQWSEADQKVWIINELPMEDYLRGLAESSNNSEPEYQKALVTAARSYALYHHDTGTKHLVRHFDVMATVSDQYYRGFESEKRLTNVSAAVDATRGQVVTYNGNVVITPYSASTDGVTRAWEDVWGGTPKPWLVRKPVPKDVGRQRFGHGVGLSQLAANDMAKDGTNYVDILKFFYVNTDVAQWY